MKRIKGLLFMMTIFLATGCVQMQVDMSINKDKSMNLSIKEAISTEFLDMAKESGGTTTDSFSEKDKEELIAKGFEVEEYNKDGYQGYIIKKGYKNIDEVSLTSQVDGNISLESDAEELYFTVKKGFFKNKYTANLTFKDSDEVSDQMENNQSGDHSQMLSTGMKMEFVVKLPYKSLNNNATSDLDGKQLTWDLLKFQEEKMQFTFELYNMTNVYITIALGCFMIILIIIFIIRKLKNKKNTPQTADYTQNYFSPEDVRVDTVNVISPSESNISPDIANQESDNFKNATDPTLEKSQQPTEIKEDQIFSDQNKTDIFGQNNI